MVHHRTKLRGGAGHTCGSCFGHCAPPPPNHEPCQPSPARGITATRHHRRLATRGITAPGLTAPRVTSDMLHQCHASPAPCITSAMHQGFHASPVPCITSAMHHQCLASRVPCITSAMHQECHASPVPCIKTAMHHRCHASRVPRITSAMCHQCHASRRQASPATASPVQGIYSCWNLDVYEISWPVGCYWGRGTANPQGVRVLGSTCPPKAAGTGPAACRGPRRCCRHRHRACILQQTQNCARR